LPYPASRFLDDVPGDLVEWRRVEVASARASSTPAIATIATIAQAAARPTAKSPGNRPVPALAPGDRVTHDTFGLGTVVGVEGVGERAMASVDFRGEVKRLLLRYAPVEKL